MIKKIFILSIISSFLSNPILAQTTTTDTNPLLEIKKHKFLHKEFPEFEWETIYGEKISSKDLEGYVVIINFWFVGCPPCMKEILVFNELAKFYEDKKVKFISVAPHIKEDLLEFNKVEDSESIYRKARRIFKGDIINYAIIPFCKERDKRRKSNQIGIDCNACEAFKVIDFPTTFILNKTGMVTSIKSGFPVSENAEEMVKVAYQKVIDRLLEENN